MASQMTGQTTKENGISDPSHVEKAVSCFDKGFLDNDEDTEFTPAEQRKIIHRIDRRLLITCGVMYCVSLMDRTNLSAAAIAGMVVELELYIGFRYVSMPAGLMIKDDAHNLCSLPSPWCFSPRM